MAQASERLRELGCKGNHVFKNLATAKAAVARAEARKSGKPILKAPASKALAPKPIAPLSPDNLPDSPIKPDSIASLKAAALSEREVSKKCDLLTELSAKQFEAMNKASDLTEKTNLTREWQRTETARAQALLAERIASPSAAKARKYIDAASK
jgi:hypothetical protein